MKGLSRGCSSMAEHQLPKLTVRVRFSSPAQSTRPPRLGALCFESRLARRESGGASRRGATALVSRSVARRESGAPAPKAAGGSRHAQPRTSPEPHRAGTHQLPSIGAPHLCEQALLPLDSWTSRSPRWLSARRSSPISLRLHVLHMSRCVSRDYARPRPTPAESHPETTGRSALPPAMMAVQGQGQGEGIASCSCTSKGSQERRRCCSCTAPAPAA